MRRRKLAVAACWLYLCLAVAVDAATTFKILRLAGITATAKDIRLFYVLVSIPNLRYCYLIKTTFLATNFRV